VSIFARFSVLQLHTESQGLNQIKNFLWRNAPNDNRIYLTGKKIWGYVHFQSAAQLLKKDVWMAILDLKDAYYSVPINTQPREYLKFEFNGTLYAFTSTKWLTLSPLGCLPSSWNQFMQPWDPKDIWYGEQRWHSGESTCLPSMSPGFDSPTPRHMWVEFVVGSHPCSEVFLQVLQFCPLLQNKHFQIPILSGFQYPL